MRYVYSDGGRWASGFRGKLGGDCVCRAISIASGRPYGDVHEMLERVGTRVRRGHMDDYSHPEWGIRTKRPPFNRMMRRLGFRLLKTRFGHRIVRLRNSDLPLGRLVVMLKRHAVAVIDRVLYDTFDSRNKGTAIVHEYYIYEGAPVAPVTLVQRPSHLDGVVAMITALTDDIVYELENREWTYAYSREQKELALEDVAYHWPNVDRRRWDLAVTRGLDIAVERKLQRQAEDDAEEEGEALEQASRAIYEDDDDEDV